MKRTHVYHMLTVALGLLVVGLLVLTTIVDVPWSNQAVRAEQDGLDEQEEYLLQLINNHRASAGCGPVLHDAELQRGAEQWAKEARTNCAGQPPSCHPHPREVMADVSGSDDHEGAYNALFCPEGNWCWSRSPPHNEIITTCAYTRVGIGHAPTGDRKGKGWSYDWAWVARFEHDCQDVVPVGAGSSHQQLFVDAYNRNSGKGNLGCTENGAHWWGEGSKALFIQDFSGGNFGNSAIIHDEVDNKPLAYVGHGAILNKYFALGGWNSVLGAPISDEFEAAPSQWTTGRGQGFEHGDICSSKHGTFEVHGAIFIKYASMGGTGSDLGFPKSDEFDAAPAPPELGGTTGRGSGFENGDIYSSFHGTYAVYGNIFALYGPMGGTGSWLGFPTGDRGSWFGLLRQPFEGGSIICIVGVCAAWPPGGGPDIPTPVPPTPTSTPTPTPGPGTGVTLYEHANYSYAGKSEFFDSNDPDLSNNTIDEDTTSSIWIEGDYWAILFQDRSFEGGYEIFSDSDPDLSDNLDIGNDTTSSIVVGRGDPPADGVWLYQGPDYTETAERFNANDPDVSNNTIGEDTVTSIRIQGNYWAILFRDRSFEGDYEIFDKGDVSLHDNSGIGNDSTSSIIVGRGDPPANGVWLYQGPDYTETAERFDANDPDINNNAIGEDTVTSIRIQGNYWAILFRDRSFEGGYEIFDKGDVSLHDNTGIGNDSTSSIMVGQGEPPANGVWLYRGPDYTETAERFDANDPDTSNNTVGEDTVTSVRIQGDYWAILFRDRSFNGDYEIFDRGDVSLHDNPDIGNDSTSSIVVGQGEPPADSVWLYRGPDYTEVAEHFDADDPDLGNNTVGEDMVSSIRIQGDYWAILFRDRSFAGNYEIFDGGDVSLHDNPSIGNDSASSVTVGQGEPPPWALFGDFNWDCVVDVADIQQVASRWRCKCWDSCYDPPYDLDSDCDIDIVDIMLVVAHWGETCE
jgi:hypothetical protein